MNKSERNKILNAFWPALAFVLVLAGIHAFQSGILAADDARSYRELLPLNRYGMRPRKAEGIIGVGTMPFLHGSWNHLYNNAIALLFLGWTMIYFYRELVIKTVVSIMVIGGVWLWFAGELGSNHIGASGLVYGLVTFLFFSGVLRAYKPLIAISMLIVFLYGSLIWGVFPVKDNVSWEGHLWGGVAGVVMAFYYKYSGPQRPKYAWELEDDEADDAPDAPWRRTETIDLTEKEPEKRVVYHYRPRPAEKKKPEGTGSGEG